MKYHANAKLTLRSGPRAGRTDAGGLVGRRCRRPDERVAPPPSTSGGDAGRPRATPACGIARADRVVSAPDAARDGTSDRTVPHATASSDRPASPGSWRCMHRRCIGCCAGTAAPAGVDGPADRSGDPSDRDVTARRARPRRHEEAGPDPRRGGWRAMAAATSSSIDSQQLPRLRPHRDRRVQPRRVQRDLARRDRRDLHRRVRTRGRVVRRARRHDRSASSPTTAPAIAAAAGATPADDSRSNIAASGPTRHAPTARSNASTAPCSTNGPTSAPTGQTANDSHALARWLHTYNHHRCHTALGGQPPMSRLNNVSGQNS